MAKYAEGYYLIKDLVLLKLELPVVDDFIVLLEQEYLVYTVAVSRRVDKTTRKRLLDGSDMKVAEHNIDHWQLQKVQEDQLDTIKLLFDTSDQSAEGTTVEAKEANSIVSDAKSSGGQNDNL